MPVIVRNTFPLKDLQLLPSLNTLSVRVVLDEENLGFGGGGIESCRSWYTRVLLAVEALTLLLQ